MGITLGLRGIQIAGSSGRQYWTKLILALITGGVRLTWINPDNTNETEIYVSINRGAYTLVTTVGLGVQTYDYMNDDYLLASFQIRAKYDTTVLNVPASLAVNDLGAGLISITWLDNNTEADHIEVWTNVANAGYTLQSTVLPGVQIINNLNIGGGVDIKCKIRAKEGTLPVYSSYTSEVEITTTMTLTQAVSDGNTRGWYDSQDQSTMNKNAENQVTVWTNKLGVTESNFDVYGGYALWSALGLTFDGSGIYFKTHAFTLNQPVYIYIVVKPITYKQYGFIIDGVSAMYSGAFLQQTNTPDTKASAGTASALNAYFTIGNFHLVRLFLNGASSKLQIDGNSATTWNCGAGNMGGIVIGGNGGAAPWSYPSNVTYAELIVRGNIANETAIYNALKAKYSL
jgi:hypothetical protein